MEAHVVTLTLDNDEKIKCEVICKLEVQSKSYVALSPILDDNNKENTGLWIYRFIEDPSGEGNHQLDLIEDDAEYNLVSEAYDKWCQSQLEEEN